MERFIEPLVRAGISESTIEDILCKIDEAQEVISEGSNLADTVSRAALKGKAPISKYTSLRDKAMRVIPSDGDVYRDDEGNLKTDKCNGKCLSKNDIGEFKTKERSEKAKEKRKAVVEALMDLVEEIKNYNQVRGMLNGNDKKQLPAVKAQPKKEIKDDLIQAANNDTQLQKARKQAPHDAIAKAKAERLSNDPWKKGVPSREQIQRAVLGR